jgi:hypothetical protein
MLFADRSFLPDESFQPQTYNGAFCCTAIEISQNSCAPVAKNSEKTDNFLPILFDPNKKNALQIDVSASHGVSFNPAAASHFRGVTERRFRLDL